MKRHLLDFFSFLYRTMSSELLTADEAREMTSKAKELLKETEMKTIIKLITEAVFEGKTRIGLDFDPSRETVSQLIDNGYKVSGLDHYMTNTRVIIDWNEVEHK